MYNFSLAFLLGFCLLFPQITLANSFTGSSPATGGYDSTAGTGFNYSQPHIPNITAGPKMDSYRAPLRIESPNEIIERPNPLNEDRGPAPFPSELDIQSSIERRSVRPSDGWEESARLTPPAYSQPRTLMNDLEEMSPTQYAPHTGERPLDTIDIADIETYESCKDVPSYPVTEFYANLSEQEFSAEEAWKIKSLWVIRRSCLTTGKLPRRLEPFNQETYLVAASQCGAFIPSDFNSDFNTEAYIEDLDNANNGADANRVIEVWNAYIFDCRNI